MSKPTANLSAGSRGSDPRPLGLTVGGRSDRTFGEATPCIKDCVLVEGQANQAVAALTLGPGIARRGHATDRHRRSDRGWASVPVASIVSFSCRSGLRRARQRIAHFLLFLSPMSATRPSPPNDSDTAVRMAVSPRDPSLGVRGRVWILSWPQDGDATSKTTSQPEGKPRARDARQQAGRRRRTATSCPWLLPPDGARPGQAGVRDPHV